MSTIADRLAGPAVPRTNGGLTLGLLLLSALVWILAAIASGVLNGAWASGFCALVVVVFLFGPRALRPGASALQKEARKRTVIVGLAVFFAVAVVTLIVTVVADLWFAALIMAILMTVAAVIYGPASGTRSPKQ